MAFYENYVKLCNLAGKSPSAVAVELKLGKPSVTRWKHGAVPRDTTILKIAGYFGVSVEELTQDIKKETPAHQMVDERLDPNTARLIELYSQLSEKYRELYLQQLETLVLALQDGEREKNTQG